MARPRKTKKTPRRGSALERTRQLVDVLGEDARPNPRSAWPGDRRHERAAPAPHVVTQLDHLRHEFSKHGVRAAGGRSGADDVIAAGDISLRVSSDIDQTLIELRRGGSSRVVDTAVLYADDLGPTFPQIAKAAWVLYSRHAGATATAKNPSRRGAKRNSGRGTPAKIAADFRAAHPVASDLYPRSYLLRFVKWMKTRKFSERTAEKVWGLLFQPYDYDAFAEAWRRTKAARRADKPLWKNPRKATSNPTWSATYRNRLPDASFLYVERGGHKDASGRTTPRKLRHFPVKDAQGRVSEGHVRSAIGRIPQAKVPGLTASTKAKLQDKARALLGKSPAKPPTRAKPAKNKKAGARRNAAALAIPVPARPSKAQLQTLADMFTKVRDQAARTVPELATVSLRVKSGIHDSPRHFAMTGPIPGGRRIEVVVAPELAAETLNVIRGVLRHEFGHAAAFLGHGAHLGGPLQKAKGYDAKELQADRIAERLFNDHIYYDPRGVEVSGPNAKGRRPRPAGLV